MSDSTTKNTKSTELELVSPATAHDEKQLEAHKKNIRVFADGVTRSGAQLYGYAFLAGREMNLAAQKLPHGNLLPWIQENFPDLSNGTVGRWRTFATDVEAKFPTVGNLKPMLLLGTGKAKKTFSKKEQEEILKVVPEMMDGKGMVEFMRDAKLLREPQEDGGYRPNKEALKAFLKEFHPDLADTAYDALPEKIQKEFRKWYKPPPPDPEILAESNRAFWREIESKLAEGLEEKTFAALSLKSKDADDVSIARLQKLFFDASEALKEVLNKSKK